MRFDSLPKVLLEIVACRSWLGSFLILLNHRIRECNFLSFQELSSASKVFGPVLRELILCTPWLPVVVLDVDINEALLLRFLTDCNALNLVVRLTKLVVPALVGGKELRLTDVRIRL